MPMTDDELATFCGLAPDDPLRDKFVQTLSPEKRALFDRMATIEVEVALWQDGLGPKPEGVLIDTVEDVKRRRGWRRAGWQ
jgi:hypothetical protein